ncbi:MAG: hypothetical protein NTNFB02_01820 [Nitrospira sp.]
MKSPKGESSGTDVSKENDGRLKLEYNGGFGGLARKEWTYEAVQVLGGTSGETIERSILSQMIVLIAIIVARSIRPHWEVTSALAQVPACLLPL